jgi:hypothetical protein
MNITFLVFGSLKRWAVDEAWPTAVFDDDGTLFEPHGSAMPCETPCPEKAGKKSSTNLPDVGAGSRRVACHVIASCAEKLGLVAYLDAALDRLGPGLARPKIVKCLSPTPLRPTSATCTGHMTFYTELFKQHMKPGLAAVF